MFQVHLFSLPSVETGNRAASRNALRFERIGEPVRVHVAHPSAAEGEVSDKEDDLQFSLTDEEDSGSEAPRARQRGGWSSPKSEANWREAKEFEEDTYFAPW